MAVNVQVKVLWDVVQGEDGGSMDLWNVGVLTNTIQHHNPENLDFSG
jgi:hypothetical protein